MTQPTPILPVGKPAPVFTLTSVSGDTVSRGQYRGRRHLALVFLPADQPAALGYLQELIRVYPAIREADGELLALLGPAGPPADALRAQADPPFPLLLDAAGVAAGRYLPAGAACGLFILDRYGALHAQYTPADLALPAAAEVVEWLNVLDRQCSL